MKKLLLSTTLLFMMLWGANAQNYFADDFQTSDINLRSLGYLNSENWTLYNDDFKPESSLPPFDEAWNIYRTDDGAVFAASPSFFITTDPADRWMVTKAVDLGSASAPVLTFCAKTLSTSSKNRDGFVVKISTKTNVKEDFETSLLTVRQARTAWFYYSIDLSAYKGQTVYIAFVQNSEGCNIIGLDNVVIGEKAEYAASVSAATPYTHIIESLPYTVDVNVTTGNIGNSDISSLVLCYSLDGGAVQKQKMEGIGLEALKTTSFTLPVSLENAGTHKISVYAEDINGSGAKSEKTELEIYTVLKSAIPFKTTMWEIFSSGTCTNCPAWNKTMHAFAEEKKGNDPDNAGNLVIAKYQCNIPSAGDPFVTDETLARCNFYNNIAAPRLYLNGRSIGDGVMTFDTTTPLKPNYYATLLGDSMESFRKQSVCMSVGGLLTRTGDASFKVSCKVTSYLPTGDTYNLYVCLMEDYINYSLGTQNGEKEFYNIVRKMLPDNDGTLVEIDKLGGSMEKDFEYTFTGKPVVFSSFKNISAVVFLQNTRTGEVIHARYLKEGHESVANSKPIKEKAGLKIYPNPARNTVNVVFATNTAEEVAIKLFDMNGRMVYEKNWSVYAGENRTSLNVSELQKGSYVLGVYGKNSVKAGKLIVK